MVYKKWLGAAAHSYLAPARLLQKPNTWPKQPSTYIQARACIFAFDFCQTLWSMVFLSPKPANTNTNQPIGFSEVLEKKKVKTKTLSKKCTFTFNCYRNMFIW